MDKTRDERAVKSILERFDFGEVASVMRFLDWRWRGAAKSPSQDRIRTTAEKLLGIATDEGARNVSTGGLYVTRDAEDNLRLSFVVEAQGYSEFIYPNEEADDGRS